MQEAYKTYVCLVLSTTLIRYMMCTQHGRPSLKCNAAQIVLKYLLLHRQLLCKTWRGRLYYFSSGTAFNDIADDLNYYIDNEPKGKKHIPKLKDVPSECCVSWLVTRLSRLSTWKKRFLKTPCSPKYIFGKFQYGNELWSLFFCADSYVYQKVHVWCFTFV